MGEESGDDQVFVPLRLFYAGDSASRRDRDRERRIAEHVERHREHGGRPVGQARGLTRADIVAAAVAIADAEGTGALSIRRIA
ncbi:MAG: hypothetical protein ACRDNW_09005, partial [Trebonia sp.]